MTNTLTPTKYDFSDLREMIGKYFRKHKVGVDRIREDRCETAFDEWEYETARKAFRIQDYSPYVDDDHAKFPVDVYYEHPLLIKIRERFLCYEVEFFLLPERIATLTDEMMRIFDEESNKIICLDFMKTNGTILSYHPQILNFIKTDGTVLGSKSELTFWGINGIIRTNYFMRKIVIDVLERMGQSHYIYRDIARCIKSDGYILIHDSLSKVEKYHNPNELIRGLTETKLKMNFNRKNLNYSYCIAYFSRWIDERDYGILTAIPESTIMEFCGHTMDGVDNDRAFIRFVSEYYCGRFVREKSHHSWLDQGHAQQRTLDLEIAATEYVRDCFFKGESISLRISSEARLLRIGDEARSLFDLFNSEETLEEEMIPENLIPDDSRFSLLKTSLPQDFELITTYKRLIVEGLIQHNCVQTYWCSILSDICAIVHWERKKRYTIEVRVGKKGYLRVAQMRGPCNSLPAPEDEAYVTELISKIHVS